MRTDLFVFRAAVSLFLLLSAANCWRMNSHQRQPSRPIARGTRSNTGRTNEPNEPINKKSTFPVSASETADSTTSSDLNFNPTLRPTTSKAFSLPKINRKTLRNVKLWFLLSVISLEVSTELFVRMPQEIVYGSGPAPILDSTGQESVVLIFPGAGGPDIHTDDLLHKIKSSDKMKGVNRYVKVYDWGQWRGNFLRAAFDGQGVGARVCSQLARDEDAQLHPIKSIHAIGVSVGAFAADSCVKAFDRTQAAIRGHNSNSNSINDINSKSISNNNDISKNSNNKEYHHTETRLTLLDPFTSKGVFGYGWGLDNFGRGVDLVEDYINTDDPVPTTNDPVKLAFSYDITNTGAKKSFHPIPGESYHSWPVQYLADHWVTETDGHGHLRFPSKSDEPQGEVVQVP